MVRGSPCMCMSTIAAFRLAASGNIFSSPRPAVTSLMIDAPASSAALATSDLDVSIETEMSILARSSSITGSTRFYSSFADTGFAPGRVDSPPMSIMSAPSDAISIPRATAALVPKNSPPSENESGVTLRTPMIIPRLERSTILSPIFQSRSPIKNQTNTMGCLFEACVNRLFLRIASHQFALRDHVAFHGGIHIATFRAGFQIEHLVEREDFEIIAVRSGRRLRSVVALAWKIIGSLKASFGHAVLRNLRCFRIDVPNQPMREQSDRRVRIVHDQCQAPGFRRRAFNSQFRITILPILTEFLRNGSTFLKCGTSDFHFSSSCSKCSQRYC